MRERTDNAFPRGFGGTIHRWRDLLPRTGCGLSLPEEGNPAGPWLQLPQSVAALDWVSMAPVTESMGRVEAFLDQLADNMREGGLLALEALNKQSPMGLRRVVEGRSAAMDPCDSIRDPSQELSLRRLLAALSGAGFLVQDCYRVPAPAGCVGPEFVDSMFKEGFLPLVWLPEQPPWKYWIKAVKDTAPTDGSVIVFGPDEQACHATSAGLVSVLPADWEVLVRPGADEAGAINRALVESSGQVLWLLRGGSTADSTLFGNLQAHTPCGPAVPADREGNPAAPGDISGLMISRDNMLLTGPLSDQWTEPQIFCEDYRIRIDNTACNPTPVAGRFSSPPPAAYDLESLAREGEELMSVWAPAMAGRGRHVSDDDPRARANKTDRETPWQGRAPRISLCMIARDEEKFIGDCLDSARPFVDEIVVVDTGSVDRTIEIAEQRGAKIIRTAWTDNFSAPRNLGLEHCTGDWLLVLDADEILTEEDGHRIRDLVQDDGVAGYHLKFTNLYTGGKTIGVLMVRLFRNLPGIQWVNRIHEQITPSLVRVGEKNGLILSIAEIEVIHRGYSDEVIEAKNKNERNERLFRLQLEDDPEDIYTLYKFGDFLRRLPTRAKDARETLERCLQLIVDRAPIMPRGMPYASEVAALCALEAATEDNFVRAEAILETAFRRFVSTPNLHYIAASVALHRQRWDEAIAQYRRCLMFKDCTLVVPIQDGITSYVSFAGIAEALLGKGKPKDARRMLEKAIRIRPSYDVSHMALSRLHMMEGDPRAALVVLTDYLSRNPESAGACHQATLILRNLGLNDHARQMGNRALHLMEQGAMEHEAKKLKKVLARI